MNGDIMKLIASHRPYSRLDIVERLRADLLSGDVERARSAAASVRASFDIRDKARRASSTIVVEIDGVVTALEPDSPLLPDLARLVPLVAEMFPLDASAEPPGFVDCLAASPQA
jgi:hypothetical protein